VFVENGSWVRIKYVNLAYSMGPKFLERTKLSKVQFYGVVDNLAMFQRSDVPDAEAVNEKGTYTGAGYPLPRKVTLGVNIGF
jgi:hypothetical protein